MTDFLSANELQPCLPGQVLVNIGGDVWVTWPNGNTHTGAMIGVCSARCYPGNPLQVVTVGRVPYAAYNLGAGNESSIVAGNFPSRGTGGTVIGTADPAGEITVLPSYVGQGVPFSPAPGLAGQFFMTNAVPATAWVSLTGDVSASATTAGLTTVVGIQGYPVDAPGILPPNPDGFLLRMNGTTKHFQFTTLISSDIPALAGDVVGNINATQVQTISGNAGNANLNANLIVTRDNAISAGSSSARLLSVVSSFFGIFNAANDAHSTMSVSGSQITYGAGGSLASDLRTYRSTASQYTVDNGSGGNANLVVTGKSALQGAATDYTAYGATPGATGFVRANNNAAIIGVAGLSVLSADANNNITIRGNQEFDIQVNGTTQLSTNSTTTSLSLGGQPRVVMNTQALASSLPLAGINTNSPLQFQSVSSNIATSVNTTFTVSANAPIQVWSGVISANVIANMVFPSIRAVYVIDAANVNTTASGSSVVLKVGSGSKTVSWGGASSPGRIWLYVDGLNSVYYINFT